MERNQHVKNYLTYYTDFPQPPHYAVMLNGPWGIGKTFLLKAFLEPAKTRGLKVVYVSLYGLTSLEEIDDALVRALFPILDNRATRITGRVVKSFAGFWGVTTDLKPTDVFDKAKADLFVFDDLERCEIAINRVLGYINEFVEHEDRKVIIIANEAEIKNQDQYRTIREKLIGKTLQIQSAFEEALIAFTAAIRDPDARAFLTAKASLIHAVYDQSRLHNLRILQQTMWDFERFWKALKDEHRKNDRGATALLQLLFAISIEFKAGRLKAADVLTRQQAAVQRMMRAMEKSEDRTVLEVAQERYPMIDLSDTALSDETLIDLFERGIVDADKIQSELDMSSYYVDPSAEPSWRTVWHISEKRDDEVEAAIADMERAFAAREYTRSGEILQVTGLRLWLSTIRAIPISRSEVLEQAKQYVDDLYVAKRLEPVAANDGGLQDRLAAIGGLGVYERDSPEYKDFFAYFYAKRQSAAIDQYPAIAEELLRDLVSDPDRFYQRVVLTNRGDNEFYKTPVLAKIAPERFVEALLSQHPTARTIIMGALVARYENDILLRGLAEEVAWLRQVQTLLLEASRSASSVSRYRIQVLRQTLNAVIPSQAHQLADIQEDVTRKTEQSTQIE